MKRLFDQCSKWFDYSAVEGQEHDIWGWDGIIFLEKPIKCTVPSAYPYHTHCRIYHYTNDWRLISITEGNPGLWTGNSYREIYIDKNENSD